MKVKREVKLALTAIVAVVILIWGINFLKAKALFDRNNVFYGIYDRVDGLKVSSSVIYRGCWCRMTPATAPSAAHRCPVR